MAVRIAAVSSAGHVNQCCWEADNKHGIKALAKTAGSLRAVTLPAALVEHLRAHKAAQAAERLRFGGIWGSDLIFCKLGGAMLTPSAVSQQVGDIARAAGIPGNVAPLHGLRHAHARSMLAQRVDIKTISARLGHASIRETADTYLQSVGELDQAAAEASAALLLPARPAAKIAEPLIRTRRGQ
jgi:integrase